MIRIITLLALIALAGGCEALDGKRYQVPPAPIGFAPAGISTALS